MRWRDRLRTHDCPTIPARNLYAGDHWTVITELLDLAAHARLQPHLWVASAGYGLVSAKASVRPYSATFSRGHADSVFLGSTQSQTAAAHRQWWQVLCEQGVFASHEPRSISRIAESNPRARVLVVASPTYVAALEDDLRQAAGMLHRPEQLLIVSAQSALATGALAPHLIPSSARLQAQLGGARLSLHARVARDILQRAASATDFLDAPRVREYYEQLIQRSASPMRYERTHMTDEEVRQFIKRLRLTDSLSCSAALRRLRDGGHACEQKRFKRLFLEAKERT